MSAAGLRRAADGNGNVCLESVQGLVRAPCSLTEHSLATEVAASFALCDLVAEIVGIDRQASIPELTGALAMISAEIRALRAAAERSAS